jgi:cell division protein FtsL
MYSINHYTTIPNKTVAFATVYVMNVCYKYPNIYNIVRKNEDTWAAEVIIGLLFWVWMILLAHSIIRTCMDPFSVKLHTRIAELESKLSEEEDSYLELYNENCKNEEKIVDLMKKLEDAQTRLSNVDSPFLVVSKRRKIEVDTKLEDAF